MRPFHIYNFDGMVRYAMVFESMPDAHHWEFRRSACQSWQTIEPLSAHGRHYIEVGRGQLRMVPDDA